MAQILVRELGDDIVAALKEQAKEHHRSLEGEVRAILQEVAERRRRHAEFLAEIERLDAELATTGRPQTDSVELLREAREERERQWDSW
jgi:plasmid stability protein